MFEIKNTSQNYGIQYYLEIGWNYYEMYENVLFVACLHTAFKESLFSLHSHVTNLL